MRLPFPMLLCHAGSPGFLEGVVETFVFDAKSRAEFSKAAAIFWPQGFFVKMKQGERQFASLCKKMHSFSEIILPIYVHFFILCGQIMFTSSLFVAKSSFLNNPVPKNFEDFPPNKWITPKYFSHFHGHLEGGPTIETIRRSPWLFSPLKQVLGANPPSSTPKMASLFSSGHFSMMKIPTLNLADPHYHFRDDQAAGWSLCL